MARSETSLDPNDGPVAKFKHDLRELRKKANFQTLRQFAQATHYSPATLSQATHPDRPMPTWDVTACWVRACGGDPDAWRQRWKTAKSAEDDGPQGSGPGLSPEVPPNSPPSGTSTDGQVSPLLMTVNRTSHNEQEQSRHPDPVLELIEQLRQISFRERPSSASRSDQRHPSLLAFQQALRDAYYSAGPPTLHILGRIVEDQHRRHGRRFLGKSTLHDLINGHRKRLPSWEVVSSMIHALRIAAHETGLDPESIGTIEHWHSRFLEAMATSQSSPHAVTHRPETPSTP